MIEGTNISEPIYKLFVDASVKYADKVEELAQAIEGERSMEAKLLRVLANHVAQSVRLILHFWPDERAKKNNVDDIQRSA